MDRYIVQNNVTGQSLSQQETIHIIQEPGSSNADCDPSYSQHMHEQQDNTQGENQFTTKQIDTSQFNEGVSNTTYIIDNNSSNSIDSVRIGNQSFVPVVDSQLYNISVAGASGQYTIEGVVNSQLGNYIIEGPAYIVQTKATGQDPMYIQQELPTLQPLQPMPVEERIEPVKKQKKMKPEEPPEEHICNVCGAVFPTQGGLRLHSYHHNPKSRPRRYSCIGCEEGFEKDREKDDHELACHINKTGAKLNCLFCDLPFSIPRTLRTHENRHRPARKSKKYRHMCVCIKCNKAFDAIYTLKIHIKKIHGGPETPKKKKSKIKAETGNDANDEALEEQKTYSTDDHQGESSGRYMVLS